MLFYAFSLTFSKEGALSACIPFNDSKESFRRTIEEINERLLAYRMSDEKTLGTFIYDASKIKLHFVGAYSQTERLTKRNIIKILSPVLVDSYELKDLQIHDIREITACELCRLRDRSIEMDYIGRRFNQIFSADYAEGENPYCKFSEYMVNPKRLTYSHAHQKAETLMADRSLLEELEKIYSPRNVKKFMGHPVHYKITAGNTGAARDISDLLLQALQTNKRIVSSRVNYLSSIDSKCYDEDSIKEIFQNAEGGTIIIDLCGCDEIENEFATSYEEVIRFFSTLIRKYQRNTLFIFVEIVDRPGFSNQLVSAVQEDLMLIGLTEGAGNRDQAFSYLQRLMKNSKLDVYTETELRQELPEEQVSFTTSDMHKIYERLCSSSLRNKVYQAYQNVDTVVVEDKTEGKQDAYKILQEMVGLEKQKEIVNKIISTFSIQKMRMKMGLNKDVLSMHMCFTGNPGSAKTTVARLLAAILKKNEVLSTGRFVECGRADLIARYVGWTAKTVKEKFRMAKGGILFIDEAYSLVDGYEKSFGTEAINTIVQEMENRRNDTIVIFAGYPDKMKTFLKQNEGLRSRISYYLDFPDYQEEELSEILRIMTENKGYELQESAIEKCRTIFTAACRGENFGNGRFVRNLLEQAIMRQSNRLMEEYKGKELRKEQLQELQEQDFEWNESILNQEIPLIGFSMQ